MKLAGKIALLTGAAGGIGEAAANLLNDKGVTLLLTGRNEESLGKLAEKLTIKSGNSGHSCLAGDITDPEFHKHLAEAAEKRYGKLHILINNAGISVHSRFRELSMEVIRKSMEVNYFAPASLTQVLLPLMEKTDGEKMIVYTSTPSGFYGIPERAAYSAAKAAGNSLMECLRMELKSSRIRTLVFAPGYTRTDLRNHVLSGDGSTGREEQAKGAASPESVARKLVRGMEKNKRVVFTDLNGYGVYWLRSLAPGFLEKRIMKKTL